MKYPASPYDKTEGVVYFKRMAEKIRLHAAGELAADLVENLGSGFDKRCCDFLSISYDDIKERILKKGLDDEQAIEWCFEHGIDRSEDDRFAWSEFMRKRGWRDDGAEILAKRKKESGFTDRDDIRTMFDYIDADEGRSVQP